MGQTALCRKAKKNASRRSTNDDFSNAATQVDSDEDQLTPDPIVVKISGRNYALRDGHWVLELKDELRPLERDMRANKVAENLIRENNSIRLKISRLLDMLHVNQELYRLSVVEKKIGGLGAPQAESKLTTVKIQSEIDPTSSPSQAASTASLPYKISDPDRISRRLEGIVFGVGQPLLDVLAKVTAEFLDSFNIPDEEVHQLGDHEMGLVSLLFEVFPVEYLTGGSAQNCVIMAQWLLAVPKAATFAGCIGKDNIGDILTKTLTEAGINIILRVHDSHETGLCIVFDSSRGRRMALRVGAVRNSIRTAFDQPQHRALLRKARCFYAEAYTLTYALEAALELAQFAAANDRYFCLNLSATHASLRPTQDVTQLLPYVDVIFSGEADIQLYATMLGLVNETTGGLDASALGLSGWRKENGLKGRVVVVVRPTKDTLVVRDGELATFPSMPPGAGIVVDDIGFGDAFAGAFMAVLVLGGTVDECLEAGVRAGTYSLFVRGCAPPKGTSYGARKLSRRESVSV